MLGFSGLIQAAEIESSIARGGELYDKWFKVLDVDGPDKSHALYPTDKKYAEKPGANWRCKECQERDQARAEEDEGLYLQGRQSSEVSHRLLDQIFR